ncbi:uncharacterized protein ACBR49_017661 [Aulostomus maculatus]
MNPMEELKAFVSQRLQAAASEILGAIEKTVTDYEEQSRRLKEESVRHRSTLDLILKLQTEAATAAAAAAAAATATTTAAPPPLPAAALAAPATPVPAVQDALNSSSSPHTSRDKETVTQTGGLQCVFTSRTDFLKYASKDNCPYCLKDTPATEAHLMRRHYLFAVNFNEHDGTEKFVVPCMCKDLIQGRSHWHCPYCRKLLYRKNNFEAHLSKMHGFTILQESQDKETYKLSASGYEEELELGTLETQTDQASLIFEVKKEQKQEMEDESTEEPYAQDPAFRVIYVDSFIQDLNEMEGSRRLPVPNSLMQVVETLPDTRVGEIQEPSGKPEDSKSVARTSNHKAASRLKALTSKRKRHSMMSNPKKLTHLPVGQNRSEVYCCKVCGKIFNYMYTLRSHVYTHVGDKIHICGICEEQLRDAESLVQHLRTHTNKNTCGKCGKQFSNNAQLKRHKRFHRE